MIDSHWRKWHNIVVFKMCMMDEIRAKRDEIYAIARKHKAERLSTRNEDKPDPCEVKHD